MQKIPLSLPLYAALALLLLVTTSTSAQEWGGIATYNTMEEGHICDVSISPGGHGDIDCPATNPEILADGTISATSFAGDGSGISITVTQALPNPGDCADGDIPTWSVAASSFVCPSSAPAQLVLENTTDIINTSDILTGHSASVNISGGANHIAIAAVAVTDNHDFDADLNSSIATLGGQTMTRAVAIDNSSGVAGGPTVGLFYLVNPPSGNQTFSITHGGDTRSATVTILEYSGIDTSTPIGATATAETQSTNITTQTANARLVSIVAERDGDMGPDAPVAGMTEISDIQTGSLGYNDHTAQVGEREAVTTQQYTMGATGTATNEATVAVIELRAAS